MYRNMYYICGKVLLEMLYIFVFYYICGIILLHNVGDDTYMLFATFVEE